MKKSVNKIFAAVPLRVSITNHCNLRCFFCSNEGMSQSFKNSINIPVAKFEKMIKLVKTLGLQHLSITGGEPSLHPDIIKILKIVKDTDLKEVFFHTNGTCMTDELALALGDSVTKIAVSLHSPDFNKWQKTTDGNSYQFAQLISGIDFLEKIKHENPNICIEIKSVLIKNFNDDQESLRKMLDFCADRKFKLKLLNFEAISKGDILKIPDFKKVVSRLEAIGCSISTEKKFRKQSDYLPITQLVYKGNKCVYIKIGCGEEESCRNCYRCNEVFVTPELYIKPCHVADDLFDLNEAVAKNDSAILAKNIISSREFLKRRPGKGQKSWSRND